MSEKRKVALIMAGGTGGHVFPALAVADVLRAKGFDIHWLGTAAGIEAIEVPKADIALHCIDVQGVRGKGKLGLLKAPWRITKAIIQARKVLREVAPNVVLGMGGFASGPGAVAAKLAGIPLVIHEQNARAGMTNKLSLKLGAKALAAFPGAFGEKEDARIGTEIVGNPVRGPILDLPAPSERFAERTGALNVLVVGGSLGAAAINAVVPKALSMTQTPIHVWHQAGKRNIEETRAHYATYAVEGRVEPFIDDMAAAYAWADLVICRAGALTVSELAIAGVASILVPFPHAVDDHQSANAQYLAREDAAIVVAQRDLDAEKLVALLAQLNDRQHLLHMAERARRAAAPEATEVVADICIREMK
ncbi:MAG: undecaprenyldiphospho-muramoylpentapeptide beta-N-acetylglucosaminyltransferase [Pseudomonadales bacterium]